MPPRARTAGRTSSRIAGTGGAGAAVSRKVVDYVAGGAEGEEEEDDPGEDEEGDADAAPANFGRIALQAQATRKRDRAHPAHPPKTRPGARDSYAVDRPDDPGRRDEEDEDRLDDLHELKRDIGVYLHGAPSGGEGSEEQGDRATPNGLPRPSMATVIPSKPVVPP